MVTFDSLGKLSDLTATQSHEHVVEPLEVAADQATQDLFVKKLRDVEDVLAEKDGHSHLDGPLPLLISAKLAGRRVRQELQA